MCWYIQTQKEKFTFLSSHLYTKIREAEVIINWKGYQPVRHINNNRMGISLWYFDSKNLRIHNSFAIIRFLVVLSQVKSNICQSTWSEAPLQFVKSCIKVQMRTHTTQQSPSSSKKTTYIYQNASFSYIKVIEWNSTTATLFKNS